VQKNRERLSFILVLGIFAVLILDLSLFSFQIDLTSTGMYTISPISKKIVAEAKADIYLTYYLSKKLKTYEPVMQTISDFVQEYASATGGRVKVRIVDPQAAGEVNDMERLGIQGIPIQVSDQSQVTQAIVYSGIELSYKDRHTVLPLVSQPETIEYDLTSKLDQLINNRSLTVGLLIGDPSRSLNRDYRLIQKQLSSLGTFKSLPLDQPIPSSVNVLIVAGNKAMDDNTAYFIDQYIMNGGKVLFAMDSVAVDISSNNPPFALTKNPGLNLLPAYGVSEEASLVLDAYNNIVQFNSPDGGGVLKRYPEWPQILSQDTNKTNPVTSHFSGLSLLWPSPLEEIPKPGIKDEVLVSSSEKSWLMKGHFSIDPDEAYMSARDPGVQMKSYPIVLALSGRFTSAYTPKTVPKAEQGAGAAPFQSLSPDNRMIVVGGSTWLTDLMRISQNGTANAQFAEAAVSWLAQDDALLQIKTRTYRDRSLTKLQDDATRNAAAFWLTFVNIVLVPLIILIVGIVRYLRRRSRELRN
jgi:gliding-associated putative ABC transporter substrate-binding component GldG